MILVWFCYLLGLFLHVLMAASDAVADKNNSINTFAQYFRKYAIVIAARFFVLICIFPFLWDNPSAFDIEGTMKTVGTQAGMSGVVGFFCDGFADHGLKLLGVTGKLPSLPGDTTTPPAQAK